MITTNIPYNRKVGLNVCNSFFKLVDDSKKDYLDVLFKRNEREAFGRRILIMIYLLEEYKIMDIVKKLRCGKATVTSVKNDLSKFEGDRNKLLKFLTKVYYDQFPEKERKVGGSRTVSGTKYLFGLDNNRLDKSHVPLHHK